MGQLLIIGVMSSFLLDKFFSGQFCGLIFCTNLINFLHQNSTKFLSIKLVIAPNKIDHYYFWENCKTSKWQQQTINIDNLPAHYRHSILTVTKKGRLVYLPWHLSAFCCHYKTFQLMVSILVSLFGHLALRLISCKQRRVSNDYQDSTLIKVSFEVSVWHIMGKFFGQILPSSSFLISIALIYLHLGKGEDKDKGWQRDEREISYIAKLVDPPAGNLNRCQCCLIKRNIIFIASIFINCKNMFWIIHP